MPVNLYFDTLWAASGTKTAIPDAADPSGLVSYLQGWTTPYTLAPSNPAYQPVPQAQSNQVLYDITAAIQQLQQNGAPPFITTAMNGGVNPFSYSLGAIVNSGGQNWLSIVANNTGIPGSSAGWIALGGFSTRTVLTANATYYVATTGNDSSGNGTSGTPWLTIQHAMNYIADNIDLGDFNATIQVADGNYTAGAANSVSFVGGTNGNVIVQGNTGTPSNVLINVTGSNCFYGNGAGAGYTVQYMKLQTSGSGSCVAADQGAQMGYNNIVFGSCAAPHVNAVNYGRIFCGGNYSIVANAPVHLSASSGGFIATSAVSTVTLTGTPAFANEFATASGLGQINAGGFTYSGAATGTRYNASLNSVINTNGGGANFFPGNGAGSVATGAQYA